MKRNAIILAASIAVLTTFVAVAIVNPPAVLIIAGALVGLAIGLSIIFYLHFRPRIGHWTSVAALSLALGLFFALIAVSSPLCPIPEFDGRCPAYAVGTVSIIGTLFPVAVSSLIFPLWMIGKFIVWVYKVATKKITPDFTRLNKILVATGVKDKKAPEAAPVKKKPVVSAAEKAAKDPTARKGHPTPKRPKTNKRPRT